MHLLTQRVDGPVVLVGHSIRSMTMLTFCRRYPDLLRSKVKGLILILHLIRLLWPVVWWMNWQSYLKGTSHRYPPHVI
jgi:pimeloyl-ACP methyl ester carboxylesterase